jgi:DNA repair protein SbcC/Rad50
MIPLYLKVTGIYSYQEAQEIDFRTLAASHLFGIFGAVGSGKSALLEAIMFALYGETERLNNRELRSYNMMNLKSNEAFIQFDFLAQGNKGEFRAIARGKRNSRNKEDVKFERTLYRVEAKSLVPVETSEMPSIIGISYENFRRTIIIPQGKFQEFLQLGARDRTDMVKELFNLHRYDLSYKTSRLQKKNDDALNICTGRLQQLGEITPEEISKQKELLENLRKQINEIRENLLKKEVIEAEYQRLKELHESLMRSKEILKELEAQQPEILLAEKRLTDFDECVSNFKTDLELLDDKKRQLEKEQLELKAKQEELALVSFLQKDAESKYGDARKANDEREILLRQAHDLETCAKVNNRLKSAEKLAERIVNGEFQVTEAKKNWESFKAQVQMISKTQETLKSQLPDMKRLQQAKDWFSTANLLKEKKNAQIQVETSVLKEIDSVEKELVSIYELFAIPYPGNVNDFETLTGKLGTKKAGLEEALLQISSQLLHLEVQEKLKSFASELHEGEACPLCGSLEHPQILEAGEIDMELPILKEKKIQNEKFLKSIDAATTKVAILLNNFQQKNLALEAARKALASAESAILEHDRLFLWKGINEQSLNQEFAKYEKVQEELEKLDSQYKTASNKVEEESVKMRDYEKLLGDLRVDRGKVQQDASTLLSELTLINQADYASVTEEAILENARELKVQYDRVGENFLAAEKVLQETTKSLQSLNGSIGKIEESIQSQKKTVEDLDKQMEARILSSRFLTEKAVREILATQMNRQLEQQRILGFREKLASVASVIQQVEKQIQGKQYDITAHEHMKVEIVEMKDALERQNEQIGAVENNLALLNRNFEEAKALNAELKELETRRENLKTLSDMFRAQGFVNFVSTMYLQNLVSSANDRFYRLTRQQLKLELDAENNFRIRDYLNEGQWRNVKTLSGGQTFQASLCLALSLADNIQRLNQSGQNFFFLDEGFGTLDRESLEQVFETLKSLRKENRIVGVISHVEDLQQEIGAWLKVTRDEEHGSTVKASWE